MRVRMRASTCWLVISRINACIFTRASCVCDGLVSCDINSMLTVLFVFGSCEQLQEALEREKTEKESLEKSYTKKLQENKTAFTQLKDLITKLDDD
jgi:hypothetical protein